VYSLGATRFWLLSGQLPYPKERNVAAAIAAIRTTPPRKLKTFSPVAPPALDALLARMLSRNPAERPTAAEAANALAGFAVPSSHPVVTAEASGDESEPEPLRAAVRQLEDELAKTVKSLDTARAALMTGLAAATVVRPGESVGHQKRVADYTKVLATELAQSAEWPMFGDPRALEDLLRAAAAHDLGLVGVPDAVLTTPNKLSPEEKTWFLGHPVVAAGIFDAVAAAHGAALPGLRVARSVVRHHHERWDGSGFPDKLSGKAIPPAARIVAVADAYDTLRTGYPGRPGVAHSDAVSSIVRQSGVAFDPAVVRAFGATAVSFEAIYAAYEPEAVEVLEPEPDDEG
jgi:response regulator RpfG family c-di-GMP phosphodiesterase